VGINGGMAELGGQWERREEVMRSEGANQRGKHISETAPMTRWLDGPTPRKKSNENCFSSFEWIWTFDKTPGNSTRRFGENLDMGIFCKFF
jgi:hypothetical protein